jgi:hypothetical protein
MSDLNEYKELPSLVDPVLQKELAAKYKPAEFAEMMEQSLDDLHGIVKRMEDRANARKGSI